MTLLAVVLVHNAFDVAREALRLLTAHTSPASQVLVIDNGSSHRVADQDWFPDRVASRRVEENFGNYPVFRYVHGDGFDVIAFLHSDLMLYEQDWDCRVLDEMERHQLDLVGVVGSSELGEDGGRGLGTASNFQGRWPGTGDAKVHGKQIAGTMPAAVVDGCGMIFRREMLERISYREDFPPHHFYDRLMSCQVLEAGGRIAVVGLACDHLGGRTSVLEPAYHALAEQWCRAHGITDPPWDLGVYLAAERYFLEEYRDRKRLIPVRINGDWRAER